MLRHLRSLSAPNTETVSLSHKNRVRSPSLFRARLFTSRKTGRQNYRFAATITCFVNTSAAWASVKPSRTLRKSLRYSFSCTAIVLKKSRLAFHIHFHDREFPLVGRALGLLNIELASLLQMP